MFLKSILEFIIHVKTSQPKRHVKTQLRMHLCRGKAKLRMPSLLRFKTQKYKVTNRMPTWRDNCSVIYI